MLANHRQHAATLEFQQQEMVGSEPDGGTDRMTGFLDRIDPEKT
ncbi:hypothetical protein [Mesorhizobium sp. SARCC-RB16n]|nr:hypothetical protein [Mesorhizobium sp. SARCC-RB16n]